MKIYQLIILHDNNFWYYYTRKSASLISLYLIRVHTCYCKGQFYIFCISIFLLGQMFVELQWNSKHLQSEINSIKPYPIFISVGYMDPILLYCSMKMSSCTMKTQIFCNYLILCDFRSDLFSRFNMSSIILHFARIKKKI